jgi:hypothetical protein
MAIAGSVIVYAAGGNTIATVPSAGGTPTVLASSQVNVFSVVTDGVNAFWTDGIGGGPFRVLTIPLAGGSVSTLYTLASASRIAIAGSTLYLGDNAGAFKSGPTSGGSLTTLATGLLSAQTLAVGPTHLAWISSFGDIVVMPLAGGASTTLATGESSPRGIAIDGTNVYWTAQGSTSVKCAPIAGGSVTVISSVETGAWTIALDSSALWWGTSSGLIRKIQLSAIAGGGQPTTIGTGSAAGGALVLDATSVIWSGGQFANTIQGAPK